MKKFQGTNTGSKLTAVIATILTTCLVLTSIVFSITTKRITDTAITKQELSSLIQQMSEESTKEIIEESDGRLAANEEAIKEIMNSVLDEKLKDIDVTELSKSDIESICDNMEETLDEKFEEYIKEGHYNITDKEIVKIASRASEVAISLMKSELYQIRLDIQNLKKDVANIDTAVKDLESLEVKDIQEAYKKLNELKQTQQATIKDIDSVKKSMQDKQSELESSIKELKKSSDNKDKQLAIKAENNIKKAVTDLKELSNNNKSMLQEQLKNKATELVTSIDNVEKALDKYKETNSQELEKTAKELSKSVENVSSGLQEKLNEHYQYINRIDNSLNGLEQSIQSLAVKEKEDIEELSKIISEEKDAIVSAMDKLETVMNTADKETADTARKELNEAVESLNKTISNNKQLLEDSIINVDSRLQKSISNLKKDLEDYKEKNDNNIKTEVNSLVKALDSAEKRLDIRIDNVEINLSALLQKVEDNNVDVNDALKRLKTALETEDKRIIEEAQNNLEAAVEELNNTIASNVRTLSNSLDGVNTDLQSYKNYNEKNIKDTAARIDTDIVNLSEALSKYKTDNKNYIDEIVRDIEYNIGYLDGKLSLRMDNTDKKLSDLIDKEGKDYTEFVNKSKELNDYIDNVNDKVIILQNKVDVTSLNVPLLDYVIKKNDATWLDTDKTYDTSEMSIAEYVEALTKNGNTYEQAINQLYDYTKKFKSDSDATFDNVNTNITTLYTKAESQLGLITELQTNLSAEIQNRINEGTSIKSSIENNKKAVDQALSALSTAMQSGDSAAIKKANDDLSTAVDELNKTIKDNYATLSESQKTEVDKLIASIASVKQELQASDTTLNGNINNLNTKVDTMNTSIKGVTDGLQVSINTLNTNLSTTNSNIQTIDNRVTNLESALGGCKIYYRDGNFYAEVISNGSTVTKKLD